jgi:hypothetical protein
MLSKILHISYVGRSIQEFLIADDYYATFIRRAHTCNWQIIEKYDPAIPINIQASEETKAKVKQAFITRIRKSALETTNKQAQQFYTAWALDLGISLPNPTLNPTPTLSQQEAAGIEIPIPSTPVDLVDNEVDNQNQSILKDQEVQMEND